MSRYKTKAFARYVRKAGLDDAALAEAAERIESGRCDVDLGGGVFKQRLARPGGGRSGGFRTIVAFRTGAHLFFVHGFAKNERANVSAAELAALKSLAAVLLDLDDVAVRQAIAAGEFVEVAADDEG
ncbi:type II toxin-antitoxin system RelE/ParE family toxin [Phenylobacterium sp.]|uniref:type II toxin-antitoxin system RelE/ParE family toxin n=1 Tax=Phenylobacterium sp. TaxID=1871053 RepID=UPI00301D65DE